MNLIGEHTDYTGGLCLPFAIPYTTTVRLTRRDDDRIRLTTTHAPRPWEGRLLDAGPGAVAGWAAYAAGTLWALGEAGFDLPGMDVLIDSTVPIGAGLSSSASLEAAMAVGAVALCGRTLDSSLRRELVEVCRRAETEVVGAPTGGLDQHAVLLAPEGGALLLDFDGAPPRAVPLTWAEDRVVLVIIDTGVTHALVEGDYGSRRAECEAATAALGVRSLRAATLADLGRLQDPVLTRRARHVISENSRVEDAVAALGARDWTALGRTLNASHRSLRDDFEVSCPELDLAVDAALDAGALGARMTGGGFGGSAIALVPAERVDGCRRAVDAAFTRAGLAAPTHLDGTPSGAAAVIADDAASVGPGYSSGSSR